MNKVKKYQKACKELVKEFVLRYFWEDYLDDHYFIGDSKYWIGVVGISDYYFDLTVMEESLMYDIERDTLFDWYYSIIDHWKTEGHPNLVNYAVYWLRPKKK